jgi:hypothetical protein
VTSPRATGWRAGSTLVFAVVFVGIGIALIVETAVLGGGLGYVIGLLFVAAGAGRFYVTWRRRSLPPG